MIRISVKKGTGTIVYYEDAIEDFIPKLVELCKNGTKITITEVHHIDMENFRKKLDEITRM